MQPKSSARAFRVQVGSLSPLNFKDMGSAFILTCTPHSFYRRAMKNRFALPLLVGISLLSEISAASLDIVNVGRWPDRLPTLNALGFDSFEIISSTRFGDYSSTQFQGTLSSIGSPEDRGFVFLEQPVTHFITDQLYLYWNNGYFYGEYGAWDIPLNWDPAYGNRYTNTGAPIAITDLGQLGSIGDGGEPPFALTIQSRVIPEGGWSIGLLGIGLGGILSIRVVEKRKRSS